MLKKISVFCLALIMLTGVYFAKSPKVEQSKQCLVWTSADRDVAEKMVFLYAYNAKKRNWWDTVRILIWGPSGKLLVEDAELQKQLKKLKSAGVELYACKGCADMIGISDKLTALGIEVKYTGGMLTEMQKTGWYILTF